MPARTDLKKILVIGSGPIVIGQACEFDYSGTQGVRALRAEGFEVCLVNSNPATIMTDPGLAERTYVEPLVPEVLESVIARERPDGLLPTLGGQTALNLAVALAERGVLEKYGVELLGAKVATIEMAEDRQKFKEAMTRIGLQTPRSGYAHTLEEARGVLAEVGLPAIVRASFTLGGLGGSVVYRAEEFDEKILAGLRASPRSQVLIEESVLGWKEYELEMMRDRRDNCVVVCSIENLDPMGVHTGDSITVAPAMTLTDKEYQRMRDAAAAILREVGVETGGANVQFAVDPATGRMVVVEMNPRVSRSSALASKATGFPIAKIAAKLAIGYTLDELRNDITRTTPASFEPAIDYVVVKMPRFAFEKFPGSDPTLTTAMKSVGEVMAIGRTFREALGKAVRGLEIGKVGLEEILDASTDDLKKRIATPTPNRLFEVAELLRRKVSTEQVFASCAIDPWFLAELAALIAREEALRGRTLGDLDMETLLEAKMDGLGDARLAQLLATTASEVRARRQALGIRPIYRRVDTCAAEFEAHTPYLYSSYERPILQVDADGTRPVLPTEAPPTARRKVMILGGGPNRIGQGIEFDYCCVHAVEALRADDFETILVNCNPETVSTDYDTADRLYFEPLTFEDVLNIVEHEHPEGVIVQFGGQTPLRLAVPLGEAGVKLLGTTADAIDRAEDRERFGALTQKLGITTPAWGTATTVAEAETVAQRIGYPLMIRPSYVLGGRAMEVVYELDALRAYVERALKQTGEGAELRSGPLLLDRFLADAIEVDVDAVSDGKRTVIGATMEHIEEAGIHSGDSASVLPPYSLPFYIVETIEQQVRALATELGVVGLMNAQFAVQGEDVYLLEVNPRASRTVPFVSKVTGNELAKIAARLMVGRSLDELAVHEVVPRHVAIKAPVFPFPKLPGSDTLLGPEMRSTGEVMGVDRYFGIAFGKALLGAGVRLPTQGSVFISIRDSDKPAAAEVARRFAELGFTIIATHRTARYLTDRGVAATGINKVKEGSPHCVEALGRGEISLVINTTSGAHATRDSFSIRRTALMRDVPCFTTISAARAAVRAIALLKRGAPLEVRSLQEYHGALS